MGFGEPGAVPRKPVDVGRLKHRMAGYPEGVRPLIVGEKKNDVRAGFGGRRRSLRLAQSVRSGEKKQDATRKQVR